VAISGALKEKWREEKRCKNYKDTLGLKVNNR
jgi:hypothetical protein